MELSKVGVTGTGRISKWLVDLGMRPFVFDGTIPEWCDVVVHADFYDNIAWCELEENKKAVSNKNLVGTGEVSLACLNANVPMVLISTDMVFGDGVNFKEASKKDPKTFYGISMLCAEAMAMFDMQRVIRVADHEPVHGILYYLNDLKNMPLVLHLGTSVRLSVQKAKRLGVWR